MAPNTLTFTGTFLLIIAAAVNLYYSCDFATEAPRWVHFYTAASFFWYQTLDAIDGKQARRTNSSSPLGQLFDHGCDAFATVILVATAMQAVNLGDTIFGFILLIGI